MSYQVIFPKDKAAAEDVFNHLYTEGRRKRNPTAIRWWISHWYMRGARDFSNINFQEGTVQIGFMNDDQVLQFQYEDLVSKYQTQYGRLLGVDLRPKVGRVGASLDGLRKASVAQVGLDAAFPEEKVEDLKMTLIPGLLHYGTVGLGVWFESVDSMGIEVIPPWQLLPIPPDPEAGGSRGIMRVEMVPLDWLEKLPLLDGKGKGFFSNMQTYEVPVGMLPSDIRTKFDTLESTASLGVGFNAKPMSSSNYPSGTKKKDQRTVKAARLGQCWTKTPDGYLAEYLMFCGGKLVYREDKSQNKIHVPIHIARDIQVGSFWGRSFVEINIPFNVEMEYAIARTFQNVQEWDLFGVLLTPTTSGVPMEAERGMDGMKRLRFEPDYMAPELKPSLLTPKVPGLIPIKALEIGQKLATQVANQPGELLSGDAPGRVDSSAGLSALYEMSGVPISPTAKSMATAVGNCYRALLGVIQRTWGTDKVVDVTWLDDSLAGIVLDHESGVIKLANNALPHPDEVRVKVASEMPKSKTQEKKELQEAVSAQIITPTEYRIEVRKRGLNLPVGNEAEWQNYRRAMIENLMLFGDGKTPGEVIWDQRDMHEIHLTVLKAFMARPEFFLASPAVREAFGKHVDAHEGGLGKLPEGMPYMEQAAEEAMQAGQPMMPGQQMMM